VPPITFTRHILPFDSLSPQDFERMCLWLVQREGFERAEHLGTSGGEHGQDIVAWKDGKRVAFQCKRTQRFGPRAADIEVRKLNALPDDQRPDEIVFVLSCSVSAQTRKVVRQSWGSEEGCHFWVGSELDERVKRWPDLLSEFFGRGIARHGRPFMAPDLPTTYVARKTENAAVRSLMLHAEGGRPAAITIAFQGPGGFGKTTLAQAFCHDEAVIEAFSDGILWATLGEQPDITGALARLCSGITGEARQFATSEEGSLFLARSLHDRVCLLVIDDVWNQADLRPFLEGGGACARLVTTRSLDVSAQYPCVMVDAMEPLEAMELLQASLPSRDHQRAVRGLAERLGRMPLLLDLARGTLRKRLAQGEPPGRALSYLERAITKNGPTAFDNSRPRERRQAVETSVEASLHLLSEEARRRLFELGIFRADISIPMSALTALWHLPDTFVAEELAQERGDLALIRLNLKTDAAVTIHAVLRDYYEEQLDEPMRCHNRLIKGWGDLRVLPDDFAWRWVGFHLLRAGEGSKIRELLIDPSWIREKVSRTGVAALVADCTELSKDPQIRLLGEALRLSAGTLTSHPEQLTTQLYARMFPDPAMQGRLDAEARSVWLKSRFPSLQQVGGAMEGKLRYSALHVAVCADASVAAIGSDGYAVAIWNLDAPGDPRKLAGTADYETVVAMSDDGTCLYLGNSSAPCSEWSLKSNERTRLFVPAESACSLALSRDGQYLATGTDSGEIRVRDTINGDVIFHQSRPDIVRRIALAGSGSHLSVVFGQYGSGSVIADELEVWNVSTGEAIATLRARDEELYISGFAVCGFSQAIIVALTPLSSPPIRNWLERWSFSGNDLRERLPGTWWNGTKESCPLVVSRDGRYLVAPTDSGVVGVWRLRGKGKSVQLGEHRLHSDGLYDLALSANGRRLVTVSEDGLVKVWNFERLARAGEVSESKGDDTNVGCCFEIASGTKRSLMGQLIWVQRISLSTESQTLLSAGRENRKNVVCVWDARTSRKLGLFSGHHAQVLDVLVSKCGGKALSGSEDGAILYWNVENQSTVAVLEGHQAAVTTLAAEFDRHTAVSGSIDGTVRLWDLADPTKKRRLWEGQAKVWSVAMSSDRNLRGTHVLAGFDDGSVRCWNIGGCLLWSQSEGASAVSCVSYGPASREVISVRQDVVEIRDATTGELNRCLHQAEGVRAVTPIRGTTWICTASGDGQLEIWDIRTMKLVCSTRCDGELRDCDVAVIESGILVAASEETGPIHLFDVIGGGFVPVP